MIPSRKNLFEIKPTPGLEASTQFGFTWSAIPSTKAITKVPTSSKYGNLAKSTPNKAQAKVKTAKRNAFLAFAIKSLLKIFIVYIRYLVLFF